MKAVTLRSGKALEIQASKQKEMASESINEQSIENKKGKLTKNSFEENPSSSSREVPEYKPTLPYPSRLKKDKTDEHYNRFLEIFKQLHINLPLVEALSQMPRYTKFLKDFLTNKRKLEEISTVTLGGECSAVIQNKMPRKLRDPRSFTIPCLIGNLSEERALADLGASINLMPYQLFKKLELGEPKPTRMSL